jgi:hypothetical protein
MKTLLKLFDATLLNYDKCHLHYHVSKHSLNVSFRHSMKLISHTCKIIYFMPELLESYGSEEIASRNTSEQAFNKECLPFLTLITR